MSKIKSTLGGFFYLGEETRRAISSKSSQITKIEFSGAEYRTPQHNTVCFIFYKKREIERVFILTSMLRFHAREIPNIIQEIILCYLTQGEESSMSEKKKVRAAFRDAVFKRDNFTCRVCKKRWKSEDADPGLGRINAHHITDRNDMPNGGYVVENGVTVCDGGRDSCHMQCERGEVTKEYLYLAINSSYAKALKQSEKLGG